MQTPLQRNLEIEPKSFPASRRPPGWVTAFVVVALASTGCGSDGESGATGGGAGGSGASAGGGGSGANGGRGGGRTGSGGAEAGSSGSGAGAGGMAAGSGGAGGASAGAGGDAGGPAADAAASDDGGSLADSGSASSPDGPPASSRPDAMGAPCATGSRYAFTVRSFAAQTGSFTAYFTASPSRAPTNSVIGLSDGQKYLHDAYAAIVRFGTSGNLDARDGDRYTSLTPIRYRVTDYHFRLVVNVPAQTYSAYVSSDGMPEITIGTDLKFRDSAGTADRLSHWGVEAIESHQTRVCGFLVQ